MEAYLDNSATTRVDADVITLMTKVMAEDYGNPSSRHMKGVESEKYLRTAREQIAKTLKADEREILFTSCGTESNNMALIGTALANQRAGKHIITTCFEHASVLEPARFLRERGFEITFLKVDREGHISLKELEDAIRPDTILVSVMMVNNEIGALEDIPAIGKLIREKNPNTLFHVDAIQSYGKYRIYPKKWKIDMLSVSGHKFHGPKGIGFLYIARGTKLKPIIYGGRQQKGMRSGTDNVPGAAGLGLAAEKAYAQLDIYASHMCALKDRFIGGLEDLAAGKCGGIPIRLKINSYRGEASAPHIVSVTFEDVKSEVMLHALEDKGIYVSSGSACSSNRDELSGTLMSIGLTRQEADSTIRFSFCRYTTEEEIDYALAAIGELVPILSKYTAH